MSTAEYATADELGTDRVSGDTRDVTLSSGKKVTVRGLSRFELIVTGKGTEDSALIERRNVALCMVNPRMTEKQVEKWQKGSPGGADLAAVTAAIRDLSALGEGAAKSGVPAV